MWQKCGSLNYTIRERAGTPVEANRTENSFCHNFKSFLSPHIHLFPYCRAVEVSHHILEAHICFPPFPVKCRKPLTRT